ncbi:DUF4846 domain-containing protein [uncultured Dokdonia sp.]|uniref:DUF4846 domain-containing protein n=1 Tax=uncultured Dokdonia sp. TaxID=575653 RepID=UPI002626B6F0|nr:DUF4846 domain-containing protein [uncultured Dokdonia sp.]
MKKGILFIIISGLGILAFLNFSREGKVVKGAVTAYVTPTSLIDKDGMTIKTRVKIPEGYTRVIPEEGTFSHYIQNYQLKKADAEVINYDGDPYIFQQGHVGVLEVPVPSNGLQQCADALIRLRSEYLWETNRKDEIGFKFTSGHYCSWQKYAQGYRPKINGNKVTFSKTAATNISKENFYKYLNLIYTYAGTYSLSQELKKIHNLSDVMIGDLLIYPGFPGHVMMVGDIVENNQGERRYVFFQGNTPAQSVHIIKNVSDADINPWYDLKGKTSLDTPIYTFSSFEMVRFK